MLTLGCEIEDELTIFLVHILDLEDILAPVPNIVIGFVPKSGSSELWSGKLGERVEMEAIDCERQQVYGKGTKTCDHPSLEWDLGHGC
jgi:hypothetical protein